MRKILKFIKQWFIYMLVATFFIPFVFAVPSTNLNAIDEDGNAYTTGTVHFGEYINVSLACTDCITTFYCTDGSDNCDPDILYDESIQFFETRFIRYYSTDGTVNETVDSDEIIINTPPQLQTYNFTTNDTALIFDLAYFDAEDNVITEKYQWYVNGLYRPTYDDLIYLNSTEYSTGDSVEVEFYIGDAQYNTTPVNVTVKINDSVSPSISSYRMIPDTTPTTTETLQVVADDESDIKKITHYFTQPNGTVIRVTDNIFVQRLDNTYSSLYTFSSLGEWVYNKIDVEDANGNVQTETINQIFSVLTSLTGGGGGGGAGGGGTVVIKEDLNISQFYINPSSPSVFIPPGVERIIEFEIVNTYVDDITTQIKIDRTSVASDWMSFSETQKINTLSIDVNREGGIAGNSRFIQYYLDVPEGVENGVYEGRIIVSTAEQEEVYTVDVNVGTNLLLQFFSTSIYRDENINVTYGLFTFLILVVGTIIFTVVRLRQEQKKTRRKRR